MEGRDFAPLLRIHSDDHYPEVVTEGNLVEAAGKIGQARVVVAKHPQGKPEGKMAAKLLARWSS